MASLKKKAKTTGQKPREEAAEVVEEDEDASNTDSDDAEEKEQEDKEYGIIEYFTDRVEEDGVLWWGALWTETQEVTWCLDTNIPKIAKYNKMRAAGEKGQFMLRFDGKSQVKKRGKTRRKDLRKGGPLPVAVQAELDERSSNAVAARQSLPPPPVVGAAALQSLPPPPIVDAACQYLQAVPPPSFVWLDNKRATLFHNPDSRCLLKTFASMVGDDTLATSDHLDAVVKARGEVVYNEGWHSVPQLNQHLGRANSHVRLLKSKLVSRERRYMLNPFLQHQRSGLFVISATVNSRRSGKVAGHFIGIDCCRREFIDTFLKQRRPMSEQQWAAIGVLDWQATYLICTQR